MLAFTAAQVVDCASPAYAEDGGNGNGNGNGGGNGNGNGNGNGGGASSATSSGSSVGAGVSASGGAGASGGGHPAGPRIWPDPGGPNWLANSAARLTAPLRAFLRRTQRASARAAADLARAGESTLNGLARRVKTAPDDQDKAMAAVRRGEIVPLASVLKTVKKSVPGDVLDVALTKDVEGTWNYQITVLTPQGYYREVNVDAGHNNVTSIRPH